MISDDDLQKAMHRMGPDAADAPDLFERVAAGARRRRRIRSSAAIVGGAGVVFGAIAIAPAAARHVAPSSTQTLAGPGSDIDPGFTGVSPGTNPSTQPTSAAKAPATVPAPSPWPTDTKGCPTIDSLPPGPDAAAQARAAAVAAIPQRYGTAVAAKGFTVTKVYPAAGGQGFGIVADSICGKTLGDNSYVVELGFASDSASLGNGQLFLANFPGGWQVWFQYH
jgi:hypothetical protein